MLHLVTNVLQISELTLQQRAKLVSNQTWCLQLNLKVTKFQHLYLGNVIKEKGV